MTFPGPDLAPGPSFPTPTARDLTLTASLRRDRFAGDLAPGRLTGSIGDDVPRHIPTSLGAVEYVTVDLTDVTGQDLTDVTVQLSLGSFTTPGMWRDVDTVTHPTTGKVRAQLLIGEQYTPPAGTYWAWARIVDSPEIVPIRCSLTPIEIS